MRAWNCRSTGAGVALAAVCGWAGGGLSAADPAKPEAGKAETGKPAPKQTAVIQSPPGLTIERCRIKLIDEATIAAGRTGVLGMVTPREGDLVKKDQKVASLVDDVAKAALEVATKEATNDIEVRYADKAAEVAQAEYDVALFANRRVAQTVPEIEVKKLKLAAERGFLQTEQAQHQLDVAKMKMNEASATLKLFQIEAPFDGSVTRVYKVKGEAVREGDPILEVCSTARVKVEGTIKLKDVFAVRVGAKVSVRLDIQDADLEVEKKFYDGRLVFVDVKAQPVTNDVRVWAEVANPDNVLRAGATALMVVSNTETAEPLAQRE
jgi:RND family efflux transporter MFP subunit